MQNEQYAFYANYPAIIRAPLSFIHYLLLMLMTGSVVVTMAIMSVLTFVAPVIVGGLVVMALLRGAGIMH